MQIEKPVLWISCNSFIYSLLLFRSQIFNSNKCVKCDHKIHSNLHKKNKDCHIFCANIWLEYVKKYFFNCRVVCIKIPLSSFITHSSNCAQWITNQTVRLLRKSYRRCDEDKKVIEIYFKILFFFYFIKGNRCFTRLNTNWEKSRLAYENKRIFKV